VATPDWAGMIGYKSRDQLMADAEERWRALGGTITNFNAGGVFRTVVELAVETVSAVHDLALAVVPQGFLAWATGDWLIAKAADTATTPQEPRKARWTLVVSRAGTTGNVVIPAGSRYRTRTTALGDVLVYDQLEDVILLDGESATEVLVEALEVGTAYNVAPGAICEFVTVIPGVEAVTNPADGLVIEGLDDEDPESLRNRAQLQWPSLSRGAVREAYEAWAREVPGVVDVQVDDEHPRGDGSVDVTIVGQAGAPTPDLLDEVDAHIRSKIPNCVNLLVKGPTLAPQHVHLRLWLPLDRGNKTAAEVAGQAAVESLLATGADPAVPRLPLGQGLRLARLTDISMDVADVYDVDVLSPEASVPGVPGQLVTLADAVVVDVVRGTP
jgi:uncharacterized phage protein gp47/JayE